MRLFRSPPWDEVRYWSLDLETTGLDLATDAVLSVGMVPVRDGVVLWGERMYSLVRPDDGVRHRLSSDAMRAHHILPGELDDAPRLPDVLDDVLARLDGTALIVHHAPVDVRFLRRDCRALERRWPKPAVVDTVRLLLRLSERLRRIDPNPPVVPTALARARRFLSLPSHVVHHALYDALATAELFLVLRERLGARRLRHLT